MTWLGIAIDNFGFVVFVLYRSWLYNKSFESFCNNEIHSMRK